MLAITEIQHTKRARARRRNSYRGVKFYYIGVNANTVFMSTPKISRLRTLLIAAQQPVSGIPSVEWLHRFLVCYSKLLRLIFVTC